MKLCGAGLHDLDDPAVAYVAPGNGRRRCRPCNRACGDAWIAANPDRRRTSIQAWEAAHPERAQSHRDRATAWRKANPERARAHTKMWRARHPDRVRAAKRAWAAANPATNKAWREANPERVRAIVRKVGVRRRARIARVLATLTAAEWDAILQAAGHACIYCGSTEHITMDHLMPISRGGDHTAENVAPACGSCNSSKGAQAVAEFLQEAR